MIAAEPTELFTGTRSAPLQVVRVSVPGHDGPVRAHVDGPGLHCPKHGSDVVSGPFGFEVGVDVSEHAPGDVVSARVTVRLNGSEERRGFTLVVAEPGWTMHMVGSPPPFDEIRACLDLALTDPAFRFVLDDVESYWDRYPEHREPLRRLIDQGRLEIGSGTLLPDTRGVFDWVKPSGESALAAGLPEVDLDDAPTLAHAERVLYDRFLAVRQDVRHVALGVGASRWVMPVHHDWNARYTWPRFVCSLPKDYLRAVRKEVTTVPLRASRPVMVPVQRTARRTARWQRGGGTQIGNDRFLLEVDPARGGGVCSLVDVETEHELLAGLANALDETAAEVSVWHCADGEKVEVRGQSFAQTLTLWRDAARIECVTSVFGGPHTWLVRWPCLVPGAREVNGPTWFGLSAAASVRAGGRLRAIGSASVDPALGRDLVVALARCGVTVGWEPPDLRIVAGDGDVRLAGDELVVPPGLVESVVDDLADRVIEASGTVDEPFGWSAVLAGIPGRVVDGTLEAVLPGVDADSTHVFEYAFACDTSDIESYCEPVPPAPARQRPDVSLRLDVLDELAVRLVVDGSGVAEIVVPPGWTAVPDRVPFDGCTTTDIALTAAATPGWYPMRARAGSAEDVVLLQVPEWDDEEPVAALWIASQPAPVRVAPGEEATLSLVVASGAHGDLPVRAELVGHWTGTVRGELPAQGHLDLEFPLTVPSWSPPGRWWAVVRVTGAGLSCRTERVPVDVTLERCD